MTIILFQVNYLNMPKDNFYTKGKQNQKQKQYKTKQKRIT